MNYPLISEYIEAIRCVEDNFATLANLRPVLDDAGNPIMSSGNFAVVFKMKDEQTGKYHDAKNPNSKRALITYAREYLARVKMFWDILANKQQIDSAPMNSDEEMAIDSISADGTQNEGKAWGRR